MSMSKRDETDSLCRLPGGLFGNNGIMSAVASSAPMKRGRSWQEPMSTSRTEEDEDNRLANPPHTAPLRCSATFDIPSFPSTTFADFSDLKADPNAAIGGYNPSNYSPMSNQTGISSFESSPVLTPVNLFGSHAVARPDLGIQDAALFSSPPGSPHKRKDSIARKGDSAKNSSDDEMTFNPNDFLIPSKVTEEEISAFIQGPDEAGKYVCLYENCKNAPFGRKENIRAHVQTHLDDRRYQCDACSNKFVRPNDLKRHWQIHVNKRDFKCFCGAAFNRHDALKRHRERSEWCESSGTRGSPDSPKKDEKKRGRPKKIAPSESQERRERKALIRREVRKKQAESAASSVVSMESPPPDFDFDDYTGSFDGHQQNVSPSHTSLTPPASPRDDMDSLFAPPVSQPLSQVTKPSLSPPPSRHSMLDFGLGVSSDGMIFEDMDSNLSGNLQSLVPSSSQRTSTPDLELCSSSPRLFDFDLSSNQQLMCDFDTTPRASTSKPDDMFSKLTFWDEPQSAVDNFMGMDLSRLDITLPQSRNSDPLFW